MVSNMIFRRLILVSTFLAALAGCAGSDEEHPEVEAQPTEPVEVQSMPDLSKKPGEK